MPNFSVLRADIENVRFGAMVCPMNTYFDTSLNGTRLYDAINERGGESLFTTVGAKAAEYYLEKGTKFEPGYKGYVQPGHVMGVEVGGGLPDHIIFMAVFTFSKRKLLMAPENLKAGAINAVKLANYMGISRVNFPVVQDPSNKLDTANYLENIVSNVMSLNGKAKKVREVCLCVREASDQSFDLMKKLVDEVQKR